MKFSISTSIRSSPSSSPHTVDASTISTRLMPLSLEKAVPVELVRNRVWAWWGIALLAGGVAIGSWIRRRQWQRLCGQTWNHGGGGVVEVNLLERIEKLEEDLRSSATIIRVLSRQLEKLGIRFRVTRKTLKDPIAEVIEKIYCY